MARLPARETVEVSTPRSSPQQPPWHAQPQAAGGGGDDGLVGQRLLAAAAVPAARQAAGQVQALLAGGGERDGEGAQQGGQVADAGQRGQPFQVRARARARARLRLRGGAGGGRDGVVPLAVERGRG